MTNFEKIKTMTITALADFLMNNDFCPNEYESCIHLHDEEMCSDCILDWLTGVAR